jgi:hypothetical protein
MKRLIASLAFFMLCLLGMVQPAAAAWNPFSTACGSGGGASAVCSGSDQSKGANPIVTIITDATNIVALVAGVAAVVLLVMGSLRYITSNGDSNNVSSAKGTVVNALIGLFVIAIARTLIVYVIGKL